MLKEDSDQLMLSASAALDVAYRQYLDENKAFHDKAHGALFLNSMLYKSCVFAIDIGMEKETFLRLLDECWRVANNAAPRFG